MINMDQILLQKSGKTICWRKLSMDDEKEVDKLITEYRRSELMRALLTSSESDELIVKKSKVSK